MLLTNNKLVKKATQNTIESIFAEIADTLIAEGSISTKEKLIDGFKAREAKGSTALADGFAIPHTVNAEIKEPKVVVLKSASVDGWATLDGSSVDTVIAIVVPENGRGDHLTILSRLSGKLANPDFSKAIKTSSAKDIVEQINSIATEEKKTTETKQKGGFDVVAITACPTGIAHTYMAAEYLENAAKEMGVSIKIETQGQTVQNILTQDEVNNAKAIIIAVDREVDLSRMAGKEITKTGTKKVIADAKGWIQKALDKKETETVDASVSNGGSNTAASEGELTLENFGARAWKAVMNGVSYMLPFVIFGGILIALSFLIDTLAGHGDAGSDLGNVLGISSFFNSLGGVSMGLMVPVLTAYTMYALIGRPGLLPGFVIGMLAAGNGPVFTSVFGIYSDSGVPTWLTDINSGFAGTTAASGFIGGIAGAFWGTVVVVGVSKLLDYLPNSLRGIKQILLLPLLGTMAAAISFWFLNIPLIYLTWGLLAALAQLDAWHLTPLLAMLVAGMMAVDMGGPINKTAYVFGTVMMASAATQGVDAGYIYMAAVMAGGMVPPFAIAIATLFKRNEIWDDADKEGGVTNWVMGASFVTEGAIPFASKYPKAVIISNIIGAALAGLLIGLLGIGISAPHGGIFVIALITSAYAWIPVWLAAILWIAIILGSAFVSAMLIVFLRSKEVNKEKKVNK